MTPIAVLVAGTHGLNDNWWKPGSKFCSMLYQHRIRCADSSDPFVWCTGLDGLIGDNSVWESSGAALRWYAHSKVRHYPLSVVAHSHGGQVAAFAAAHGLHIDRLITAAMPVRKDMDAVYSKAKRNIDKWVHLHSDSDMWQVLGGLRDGKWGIHREVPYADVNICEKELSHRDFVDDKLWWKNDWCQYLR